MLSLQYFTLENLVLRVLKIIIINVFVQRHKVVTSESLRPGSVLLRKKEESPGEENVFSLYLNTVTQSLLTTVFGSDFLPASPKLKCLAVLPCDLSLSTIRISDYRQFPDIRISQGSVATYVRCGETFKRDLPASLSVKEF